MPILRAGLRIAPAIARCPLFPVRLLFPVNCLRRRVVWRLCAGSARVIDRTAGFLIQHRANPGIMRGGISDDLVGQKVGACPLRPIVPRSGDQEFTRRVEVMGIPSCLEHSLTEDQVNVPGLADTEAYPQIHLRAHRAGAHGFLRWPLSRRDQGNRYRAAQRYSHDKGAPLERVAWADAKSGDLVSCERALGQVDDNFDHAKPGDDPDWVYWLSREEIDVMAGRCYTELKQPARAEALLRNATSSYDNALVRENSLYLSWLAEDYILLNEIELAAETATRVLELGSRANSARTDERLRYLAQLLRRYKDVHSAADFLTWYRDLNLRTLER